MSKLMVDLRLIDRVSRILEKENSVTGLDERHNLNLTGQRIKQRLNSSKATEHFPADQLLSKHLEAHPNSLIALCDDVVEEVISYVSKVCDYYRRIKNYRKLTDEEKNIGKELAELLRAALELL
jgi:hypothetical protein